MKKDSRIYIEHILESIEKIEGYTENVSKEEFMDNTQLQDSVIRRFEIIGEAAKNITDDIKKEHQDILWKQMSGMRDVLIHNYMDVDVELVWNTVTTRLPELKEQVLKVLAA